MSAPREQRRSRPALWPVRSSASGVIDVGASPIFERLKSSRFRLGVTFAIFLGINLILLAAYLWSYGGQTFHVRVEARGDEFSAYLDGRLAAKGRFDAAEQGGVTLILSDTENIPSLPKPRGIDSIRVTDLRTGNVLFEDDFSAGPAPDWTHGIADLVLDNGVLGARGQFGMAMIDPPWEDYAVDATFKNATGGAISVRTEDGTGVTYGFRPFRHYDNGLTFRGAAGESDYIPAALIELTRTETLKALLAMTLGPFPRTFLVLALAFIAVAALQFVGLPRLKLSGPSSDWPWFAGALGLATFGFVVTLVLNYSYGSHMPHVPDEIAYIFQAKLLASARLTAPVPPVQDVFDFFYPPFIVVQNGRWASAYPFGHPLALSLGVKLGAIWLIPPLLGAATVLFTYGAGRKVYGSRVGFLAALLFVTSPFFLMTASNFMSHNTAAFYLAGSIFFIAIADRRPFVYGALSGLFFGLLFNTQPLTAVALIAPFGLLLLGSVAPRERRLDGANLVAGFTAGGLLMLGAYFLHNYATTGDAFTSGLQLGANPGQFVGFGGPHSASVGIQNQVVQMAFLLLVLNGWPLYIGLMFVLLPFVFVTRRRWDWFLLAGVVCALGVYVLYIGHGIMHGPRYWYAASPLLMLLAARGAERAAEVLADGAGALRRALSGVDVRPHWAGVLVVYAVVAALVGSSVYSWLLGRDTSWSDEFVPEQATALRGFNRADDRLIKLIEQANLRHALVLVEGDCPGWQCYGTVFWLNNPTLDGNIVFARDAPERRADMLSTYRNRYVYTAQYSAPAFIARYGSNTRVVREDDDAPKAPRARDIALPTPTPTATPDPSETVRRDEQRALDLQAIAGALQEYYALHGSYPLAAGLQSFCRYVELDAGCRLSEVFDPLPRDPIDTKTYYYLSAGQSFTVFAEMEGPAPPSQCPDPNVGPRIDPEHLYCVQGDPQGTSLD